MYVGMSLQAAAEVLRNTHFFFTFASGTDALFLHNDLLPYVNTAYGTEFPTSELLGCWLRAVLWFPLPAMAVADWALSRMWFPTIMHPVK